MKFIIGQKMHMTQSYLPNGKVASVTVIKADPCVVTQIKTGEKDGYSAIQLGSGSKKRSTKAEQGHIGKDKVAPRFTREFKARRGQTLPEVNIGDAISVEQFESGDKVRVIGTSKGRGFQGVVKRHGFSGSPKTHGHKDQLRMPGSIGATDAARVFKGTRMAGRMGGTQVSTANLEVVAVNKETNEILVKGAVPGAPRSVVLVQS